MRLTVLMTFFESIKSVFRKYAEFGGRATRPEFWWFVLFSALVSAALATLNITTGDSGWMGGVINDRQSQFSSTIYLGTSLASLWSIAVLLPSLAVTIRRLRDTGREWTHVLWILLPIAGLIILIVELSEPTRVAAPAAPPAPPAVAA